jgi:hypothetical protein
MTPCIDLELWISGKCADPCNDRGCPMNPGVVPLLIAAQAVIKLRGHKPQPTAAISILEESLQPFVAES